MSPRRVERHRVRAHNEIEKNAPRDKNKKHAAAKGRSLGRASIVSVDDALVREASYYKVHSSGKKPEAAIAGGTTGTRGRRRGIRADVKIRASIQDEDDVLAAVKNETRYWTQRRDI